MLQSMPGLGCGDLGELRELIGDCQRCGLAPSRTTIVFGAGDAQARVMIVGEAPGRNEDLSGEPFVGAAGRFLDELLGHAELLRSDVYIANVIKCRPPGNRDPKVDEIHTCAPFLREQVRLVSPEVVVTLGNFATRFILGTDEPISRLRGQARAEGPLTVLPVYHPAAAIYDRTKRDILLEDFATLGAMLGTGGER